MNITTNQIVEAFENSGLSYRQLAAKLNGSSGNVHKAIKKMKNGGSITTKTIEKYAKALDLLPSEEIKN